MKKSMFILIILAFFVFGCSKEISKEDAYVITKEYVEKAVKPYSVNNNGSIVNIQKPEIIIKEVYRSGNNYVAVVNIQADVDGVIKKKGIRIFINAKSGKIEKKEEFQI